jgi:transposase
VSRYNDIVSVWRKNSRSGGAPCRGLYRNREVLSCSCFVIGTSVPEKDLSDDTVIAAYKEQNHSVEKGFRFLKDPLMFASSLFLKNLNESWDYS